MKESSPRVTVIIPARPGQVEILAVEAARQLEHPRGRIEIIVTRGNQPSAQRNAAIRAAKGEFIYFLDDDSRPLPDALARGLAHFARPEVQMAGGPSVCPPEAPFLEQVFGQIMTSPLAFGGSTARYRGSGAVRTTTEKELILCNLIARRDPLLAAGGFDEKLYPGEENALMDELQRRGGILVYDPGLVVYRRPRPTIRAFARMLWNYGRSRSELFRLHPTANSAPNFVPPLFCLYLVLLALLPGWARWPLGVYAGALLLQAGLLVARDRQPFITLCACPLIALTHILYGLGFWKGLFTRFSSPPPSLHASIKLETIPA